MPSVALNDWSGPRRIQLQQLYTAHSAVGGTGPGRRFATTQLNLSIALRLAGEFQGFARDLHDESIAALTSTIVPVRLGPILQVTLALDRKLDKGNAHPGAIHDDFRRLGILIVDGVKTARPIQGPKDLKALETLNAARNAIAHSQPHKLTSMLAGAASLRLPQVSQWHGAMDRLAKTMDQVAAADIAAITGGPPPW